MANKVTLRTWATPLTIGSFLLMAVSGIMMFFDIVPGYVAFAHEWVSWAFLLGVGAHIAVNLRPFKLHLKTNWGRASSVCFALLLLVSTYSFGQITAPQLKWPLSEALVSAPLSALAGVVSLEPGDLLGKLERHGIKAEADQNILELASRDDLDPFHILGLIVLPD